MQLLCLKFTKLFKSILCMHLCMQKALKCISACMHVVQLHACMLCNCMHACYATACMHVVQLHACMHEHSPLPSLKVVKPTVAKLLLFCRKQRERSWGEKTQFTASCTVCWWHACMRIIWSISRCRYRKRARISTQKGGRERQRDRDPEGSIDRIRKATRASCTCI